MIRSTYRHFITYSLLLLISHISHANNLTQDSSPEAVINKLHQTLIEIMKSPDELDFEERYKIIEPVVEESFDFEVIGRIVLGRAWRKLSNDQKQQFKTSFSSLSSATYAAQFKGFSGEKFEFIESEKMKKERFLVKTQFLTSNRIIHFNYILYSNDENWRIINVIVDGVSDLSLKRSDYTAILEKDGFEGLINKIKEKIENYSKS